MIAIRGAGSEVVRRLEPHIAGDEVLRVHRDEDMPVNVERYLFCQGLIRPKRRSEQTNDEIVEGLSVNLWYTLDQCERIFSANVKARVCVIGSESGFAGSHDDTYAVAKAELHKYVERKRLKSPYQQLICIAPSIIRDCGMTTRREDGQNLMMRRATHPKQRFLDAEEVARLVHYVLYVDRGYLSGVTIRMNGGAHAS